MGDAMAERLGLFGASLPAHGAMSRPLEVWACPWVLESKRLGLRRRCGYISSEPGLCEYDHDEDQQLVCLGVIDWPVGEPPSWGQSG